MKRLLSVVLLLLFGLASNISTRAADICQLTVTHSGALPSTTNSYATSSLAKAACNAAAGVYLIQKGTTYSQVETFDNCQSLSPTKDFQLTDDYWQADSNSGPAGACITTTYPKGGKDNYYYTTDDLCQNLQPMTQYPEWSDGATVGGILQDDVPATGSIQALNGCLWTWDRGPAGPQWMEAFGKWVDYGTLTSDGATAGSQPPAGGTPPTKLPDDDGDGIPNANDPYPNDPGNAPPPPPPDTPPPPPPPPPNGGNNATGDDIGTLATTITNDLAAVGDKLDAVITAIDATNLKVDQVTAAESAGASLVATAVAVAGGANSAAITSVLNATSTVANTNAASTIAAINAVPNPIITAINAGDAGVDAAIHGIPGGTGTDMTATNALLTTANGLQTSIKTNTTPDTATGGQDCSAAPVITGGNQSAQAIAYQQWAARCQIASQLATSGSGDSTYGDEGTDPTQLVQSASGSDVAGQVNEDYVSFGNSCPAMPTLDLGAAGSYTIPFGDQLCDVASMIRLLMIAVAYLWAARIVLRE